MKGMGKVTWYFALPFSSDFDIAVLTINLHQLILVWTPGKGSPLHDHANAHCLMKVLSGSLSETQYTFPSSPISTSSTPSSNTIPTPIKTTTYTTNQVTYMADNIGLHKISNLSLHEVAVSLHLYTPPNAAREGCNIFDERTGRKSHITQSNFYSEFGKRVGEREV